MLIRKSLWIVCLIVLTSFTQCKNDTAEPRETPSDNSQEQQDDDADEQQNDNPLANHKTQNLVIVTYDGLRWKEVFQGADSSLLFSRKYNLQSKSKRVQKYWDSNLEDRRKKLLPFFWSYLVNHGKLYGNRELGNKVNVKNPYWFSYPGYNEIFTGYPDPRVNSNDYTYNPNVNVLGFLNRQDKYHDKIAAFCDWAAFDKILNEPRSNILVVSGGGDLNDYSVTDDQTYNAVKAKWNYVERIDDRGYKALRIYVKAKQYMEKHHPKVFFISWANTDSYAHAGKYDSYLDAAHNNNVMLGDLWNYIQTDPFYKDKTTLFITTDHGRGYGDDWTSHGSSHPHSDEVWFAVIGPDTQPQGEIGKDQHLFQNQFARTFAALLGLHFVNNHVIGNRIKSVMDNGK